MTLPAADLPARQRGGESLQQETEEMRGSWSTAQSRHGSAFGEDIEATTFLRRNLTVEGEALFTLVQGAPYRTSQPPAYNLLQVPALGERWSELEAQRSTMDTSAGEADYLVVPMKAGRAARRVFIRGNLHAHEEREILHTVRVSGGVSAGVLLAQLRPGLAPGRQGPGSGPTLTATARRINDSDLSRRIAVRRSDEIPPTVAAAGLTPLSPHHLLLQRH